LHSLRTRIAVSYAVLLVAVIVVIAVALNFAFGSILFDEARARALYTADEIARVTNSGLSVLNEPVELILANQYNLDHWAGPSTLIQIDDPQGDTLGKSSNMGGFRFPAAALQAGSQRFTILHADFGNVLVLDRPIASNGRVAAIVHIGEKLDIADAARERAQLIVSIVTIVASIAVILASYAIARPAIDPINRLTEEIEEIGSDRLDRRLGWPKRSDEVGKLAATFDAMLGRLAEAFARERQFISDASHELKTPLTVINANAQMLARWADRDPKIREESLQAIIAESAALAAMVNGMLTLAKADSGEEIPREPIPLDALVEECVRHLAERASAKNLALRFVPLDPKTTPLVMGDEKLLRQVVNNLTENAIKFTESGSVEVSVGIAGDEAVVEVADSGPGIAPEAAEHVFERFYRADASHSRAVEGTGLGLAIVSSIVRVHKGSVEVRARAGGGSLFIVRLPLLEALPNPPESVIESS
jgi:two-component system, OmpR family, sensor kinase